MLTFVAFLLIFGLVVRYKWKNAATKNEEILRLVAVTSEEETVIEKIQADDEYNSTPPQPQTPPRLENLRHCAVCYSPTTSRCSQCKVVRYCSGKCQIIHWRQGHKDECCQAILLKLSKGSECVTKMPLENQFKMQSNDGAKLSSDHNRNFDNYGSSSNSLPFLSYLTEQSQTSIDASAIEVLESGTPLQKNIAPSVGVGSHVSDSDDADVPSPTPVNCTVYSVNEKLGTNKTQNTPANKIDEVFESTISKDKRELGGATLSKEFKLGEPELRTHKSSSKRRSATEDWKNQAPSQKENIGLRTSQFSKSSRMPPSDKCWNSELKLYSGKESRTLSSRSPNNYQKVSTKVETLHALPSEIEGAQLFSEPTSKGLTTSVRKFVHHLRPPKQSNSFNFEMGKDSNENCNHKVIFPLKLFMHLYSCDSVELKPFGLINCGNSCYANAVLQCLTFTRPFTSYLLKGFHSNSCRKRYWCFICEFESLVRKGQETSLPLSPIKIMSQVSTIGSHLSHGREEDAHEFLRNIVDTMQSICLEEAGVSGSQAEDSTLMGLTFGGYLQSKIKCMKCLGRSEQCDRMMDLTVEINGNTCTLEEALVQFTTSETLGGDDKYKCSRCKTYEKAKKKLTLLEAPNILTIVLKRFQSGNLQKLNKIVQFPEVLNLAPYMSGMNDIHHIYHLYAVVVHLGTKAAYSGHYVSYVKDFHGDWFRIDDSRVSRVDLETVLAVEAYILFYSRQTPRARSLMKNSSEYSDGRTERRMETITSSNSAKNNTKTKPSPSGRYTEPTMPYHLVGPEVWGLHLKHRNPFTDSLSDSSSIFSVSDAGSYSTDSTKDSNAEEISGYIFGPTLYRS